MKLFNKNKAPGSYISTICTVLVIMFASLIPYDTAHAQIRMGDLIQKAIPKKPERDTTDKTCRGQFCGHVFISPDEISISPDSIKGDTVVITLELSNRTDTVITGVWKTYDFSPPVGIALDSNDSGIANKKRGGSLLAKKDDLSEGMSLSSWLFGFPDSVVIKPHSTIKMNVVVRVPKGLKEGTYIGWLGAMSEFLGNRPPPQKPIRMGIISKVKLTYKVR